MNDEEIRLTLVEHLGELRKRLIISCLMIIIGSILCYNYIDVIVDLIVKPAEGLEFIYLSPPELFIAYIKISLILGLFVALPIVLYQVWKFIKPGLKKEEQKYGIIAIFMGMFFLLLGVVFAYFVIIPISINFFVKMSVDQVEPLFSFANYISFIGSILLAFGVVFELPLIVILLTQLGLVKPSTFRQYRKLVILGIFILAAVLTPPDIVSQSLMGLPMILLYELSIIISSMIYKKKKAKIEEES